MRNMMFLCIGSFLLLVGCSNDTPLSDGDQDACNIYAAAIDDAQNDSITDDEMKKELEDAFFIADDDDLVDLLDELIYYMEGHQDVDLQKTVNQVRSFCSLDD